jgi:hypothetical protein
MSVKFSKKIYTRSSLVKALGSIRKGSRFSLKDDGRYFVVGVRKPFSDAEHSLDELCNEALAVQKQQGSVV